MTDSRPPAPQLLHRRQNCRGTLTGLLLTRAIFINAHIKQTTSQMITEGGVQGSPSLNPSQEKVSLEPLGQEWPFFCSRPCDVCKAIFPHLLKNLKVKEAIASVCYVTSAAFKTGIKNTKKILKDDS